MQEELSSGWKKNAPTLLGRFQNSQNLVKIGQFSLIGWYPELGHRYLGGRVENFSGHQLVAHGVYLEGVRGVTFSLEKLGNFGTIVSDEGKKIAYFSIHGRVDDKLIWNKAALFQEDPVEFGDGFGAIVEKWLNGADLMLAADEGYLDCLNDGDE